MQKQIQYYTGPENDNIQILSEQNELEDNSILGKTVNIFSSFWNKVKNAINPFNYFYYSNNPYDYEGLNDPSNYLPEPKNYQNKNYLYQTPISFHNSKNYQNKEIQSNTNILPNNSNFSTDSNSNPYKNCHFQEIILSSAKKNNYINKLISNNNNDNDIENNEKDDEVYFTIEKFCEIYPHLRDEIFKKFTKPTYIPNEKLFEEARNFIYENIVKEYKIYKPTSFSQNLSEYVILLAIQLTNKYNIEMYYDFLVNKKKPIFNTIIDVPGILQKYYTKKAKVSFHKDLEESSGKIINNLNKELINKFDKNLLLPDNNINKEQRIVNTPKTKRNYIQSLIYNNDNNFENINDKVKCEVYRECLIFKEKELQNYLQVINVTNNMFNKMNKDMQRLIKENREKDKSIEELQNVKIKNEINKNINENKIKELNDEVIKFKNEKKIFKNLQTSKNVENTHILSKMIQNHNKWKINNLQCKKANSLQFNKINVQNNNNNVFLSPNIKDDNNSNVNIFNDDKVKRTFSFGLKNTENSSTESKSNNIFNNVFSNNDINNGNKNIKDEQLFSLDLKSKIEEEEEKEKKKKLSIHSNNNNVEISKNIFGFLNSNNKSNKDENKEIKFGVSETKNDDKTSIASFGNEKKQENNINANAESMANDIKNFINTVSTPKQKETPRKEEKKDGKKEETNIEKIEEKKEEIITEKKEEKKDEGKEEKKNDDSLNKEDNPFLKNITTNNQVNKVFSLSKIKQNNNDSINSNNLNSTMDVTNNNINVSSDASKLFSIFDQKEAKVIVDANNTINTNNIINTTNSNTNNSLNNITNINSNNLINTNNNTSNPFLSAMNSNTNINNIFVQNQNNQNNNSNLTNSNLNTGNPFSANNNINPFIQNSQNNSSNQNNNFNNSNTNVFGSSFNNTNNNINNNSLLQNTTSSNPFLTLSNNTNTNNNNNTNPFLTMGNNNVNNNNQINISNPFTNNLNSNNINNNNNYNSNAQNPFLSFNANNNNIQNVFSNNNTNTTNNNSNPFANSVMNINSINNPFSSSIINNNNNGISQNPFLSNYSQNSNEINMINNNTGKAEPLFNFNVNPNNSNITGNLFSNASNGFNSFSGSSSAFSLGINTKKDKPKSFFYN